MSTLLESWETPSCSTSKPRPTNIGDESLIAGPSSPTSYTSPANHDSSKSFHNSTISSFSSGSTNSGTKNEYTVPRSSAKMRPRSNTYLSSTSTNRNSAMDPYANNSSAKSYYSASLSSLASNQSRSSADYSFLTGKDEYLVEKNSRTYLLASNSKSSLPPVGRQLMIPADIEENIQGYERAEGTTIVKTVKTYAVKKYVNGDEQKPSWETKAKTP